MRIHRNYAGEGVQCDFYTTGGVHQILAERSACAPSVPGSLGEGGGRIGGRSGAGNMGIVRAVGAALPLVSITRSAVYGQRAGRGTGADDRIGTHRTRI
jgi:hypothetical protein